MFGPLNVTITGDAKTGKTRLACRIKQLVLDEFLVSALLVDDDTPGVALTSDPAVIITTVRSNGLS